MRLPSRYLKDASHFKGHAQKLFLPSSEKEVSEILRKANRERLPLTVAGAGTGLTGARVPLGGAVLSLEKMDRILDIHWDRKAGVGKAVVQPGVTLKRLQEALEKKGLFYPPDPGETKAFLGGTLATNASGPRTLKYGPTRQWVRRVRIILPTGEPFTCTRGTIRARKGILSLPLSSGRALKVPVPAYSMPQVKNAAGYFAHPQMDFLDLFIGSEGTLGVFTEIELGLLKKPPLLASGLLFFRSRRACYDCMVRARLRMKPRALEFLDARSLALLHQLYPKIPRTAQAALFFEQEGSVRKEDFGHLPFECWISQNADENRIFRRIRYDLPRLVNEEVAKRGFRKIGTDMAVPDRHGKEMFNFTFKVLDGSGIDYVLFGHIGNNHLHANLLPQSERQFHRAQKIYGILALEAVRLKGTISAEHGVGKARIPYLKLMVGEKGLLEMARVKRSLDPNGVLNPGNIIPPEMLTLERLPKSERYFWSSV